MDIDRQILKNKIANIPIFPDGHTGDDNLGIALCSYFENLPQCPDGDVNDEFGWSQWALDQTDALLDKMINEISDQALKI